MRKVMEASKRPPRAASGRRTIRVMIVDDHEVVRAGLRSLFDATTDLEVVSEAGDERTAIVDALREKPDVILMDVRLVGGSGLAATRVIRSQLPNTVVLMLTAYEDDEALAASIAAGASGYVLKEIVGGELIRSIRAAARGELLFDDRLVRSAMDRVSRGKHLINERLARLSPQEERILEQISRGLTNSEIAKTLDLAEKTVKNYVSNVLLKLDVNGRAEAAAYLARHTGSAG